MHANLDISIASADKVNIDDIGFAIEEEGFAVEYYDDLE